MLSVKNLITISIICSLCVFSSTSAPQAMIHQIDSIDIVEKDVRLLRHAGVEADEICVVLDLHGVITKQRTHQPPLTLNDNVLKTLDYLEKDHVPYLVATGWNDFNAVIREGILLLGLQIYFDVDPNYIAELEEFILGVKEREFVGYKNGRVLALKKADEEGGFFINKAYTVEAAYPENNFKYIFVVEDSSRNLDRFRKDSFYITPTASKEFEELFYYHLCQSEVQKVCQPSLLLSPPHNDESWTEIASDHTLKKIRK